MARELSEKENRSGYLQQLLSQIENGTYLSRVYTDDQGMPQEFSITELTEYEGAAKRLDFPDLSSCIAYYFSHRASSSRIKQKSHNLIKTVSAILDKLYLKKQRLSEDLRKAEIRKICGFHGELLTASMHSIKQGDKWAEVVNYYDGSNIKNSTGSPVYFRQRTLSSISSDMAKPRRQSKKNRFSLGKQQ